MLRNHEKLLLLKGYPKRGAYCHFCSDSELRVYRWYTSPRCLGPERRISVGPCSACRGTRYCRWVGGEMEGEQIKYAVGNAEGRYLFAAQRGGGEMEPAEPIRLNIEQLVANYRPVADIEVDEGSDSESSEDES